MRNVALGSRWPLNTKPISGLGENPRLQFAMLTTYFPLNPFIANSVGENDVWAEDGERFVDVPEIHAGEFGHLREVIESHRQHRHTSDFWLGSPDRARVTSFRSFVEILEKPFLSPLLRIRHAALTISKASRFGKLYRVYATMNAARTVLLRVTPNSKPSPIPCFDGVTQKLERRLR